MSAARKTKRLSAAPFALSVHGELLLNVAGELDSGRFRDLAAELNVPGGRLFVGVTLSSEEAESVRERLAEAGYEAAARVLASKRSKRARSRPAERTTSARAHSGRRTRKRAD